MSLKDVLHAVLGLRTFALDISSQLVLAASTDYVAEDVLSNAASGGRAFLLNNMARKNGGSGKIVKAIAYISTTALTPRVTLYLFKDMPTSNLNDNAANTAPSITDMPNCVGWLDFLAMEDLGGVSSSLIVAGGFGNLPLRYTCRERALYGISVLRDNVTGEVAGMVHGFLLSTIQDS